jgi:hypothetical protein
MNDWIAMFVGYVFAVVVGHFCVSYIVSDLWRGVGWSSEADSGVRPAPHLPGLVGIVERTLFVASFQLQKSEFIGIWLALKVAGQWRRWQEEIGATEGKAGARTVYNIFLIGCGFSIAYAVVGAQLISFVAAKSWSAAIALPVVLLIGTLLFHKIAVRWQNRSKETKTSTPGR